MLIESYTLYAIAFLLYIVPWALGSWIVTIFSSMLGSVQVIAPYLIILRVANRRALTSEMITRGSQEISSIHFGSQGEPTDAGGSFPDGALAGSMEADGDAIEEVPL